MKKEATSEDDHQVEAKELPWWKGVLWWIWGFSIGLVIGA
jgi:hypothetical protein